MAKSKPEPPTAWRLIDNIALSTDIGALFFRRGEVIDDASLVREILNSDDGNKLQPLSEAEHAAIIATQPVADVHVARSRGFDSSIPTAGFDRSNLSQAERTV